MEIAHLLTAYPALFVITAVLLGLIVGSFLNVVIYRLPIMMVREERSYCAELLEVGGQDAGGDAAPFNLLTPPSRCPACEHRIGALENIPLLSYLLQKGRCRHCDARISVRYPLIEAISGLLAGYIAWHFGFGVQALAAMILTWALIALTMIDFDHQQLPDIITLPFLWIGVILALFGVFTDLRSSVIGAMAGYLSLWGVYWLFYLLTKKVGMGYGDFKLLAMLCAWQGWQSLVAIVILSSLVGAFVGIALILMRGHDRNVPIPFGPYLAAAGWIALLWGNDLKNVYFGWLGL